MLKRVCFEARFYATIEDMFQQPMLKPVLEPVISIIFVTPPSTARLVVRGWPLLSGASKCVCATK